jgi:hypothetical protein
MGRGLRLSLILTDAKGNQMNKKIKELVKLSSENPELEVIFMAYNEIVCEDYGYWKCEIKEVKIDFYCEKDDGTLLTYNDIFDNLYESASEIMESEGLDKKELTKIVENEIQEKKFSGEIREVIIVYLDV